MKGIPAGSNGRWFCTMQIRDAIRSTLALENEHQNRSLARRTHEVRTHKGQISFPGGMRHDGESLEQTALRETFEEVGIEQAGIEILGRFHDYLSITGYIDGGFSTSTQNSEVAEVLEVPFEVFLDPSRLRTKRMMRSGEWTDVFFFRHEAHEIWGLTAHIIKEFLEAMRLGAGETEPRDRKPP